MWDDYAALAPQKEAAQILSQHPWPRLYDADRLAHNDVPVAATIYVNDLYVVREYAMETARARFAASAPGRPTSSSTTACVPTASAFWAA